jgi:hypothetical protein
MNTLNTGEPAPPFYSRRGMPYEALDVAVGYYMWGARLVLILRWKALTTAKNMPKSGFLTKVPTKYRSRKAEISVCSSWQTWPVVRLAACCSN